ncbi:4976_t:CDS:2, partial [Ambispora gerdemannii]
TSYVSQFFKVTLTLIRWLHIQDISVLIFDVTVCDEAKQHDINKDTRVGRSSNSSNKFLREWAATRALRTVEEHEHFMEPPSL